MDSYKEMASVYDRLMNDINYEQWWLYYKQLFNKFNITPHQVIDIACGTGNMTILFSKSGLSVSGIDFSEDMLMVAKEKARRQGLKIEFICQDIRNLVLHRSVNLFTCCCDGINYLTNLDDVKECFLSVYKFLNNGGFFLFDISSFEKIKSIIGCNFFGEDHDDLTYLWQNEYDEGMQLCTMDLTFFIKEKGSLYRKFKEVHYQRAHKTEEIIYILEQTGFMVLGLFEHMTLQSPNEHSSRIQFICKK